VYQISYGKIQPEIFMEIIATQGPLLQI